MLAHSRNEVFNMIGKLIILAIVGVLAYAVYLRIKAKITGTPLSEQKQKAVSVKGPLRGEIRVSKIQLIITALAALYLIWALASLYR
jgi:hypothetical protein